MIPPSVRETIEKMQKREIDLIFQINRLSNENATLKREMMKLTAKIEELIAEKEDSPKDYSKTFPINSFIIP